MCSDSKSSVCTSLQPHILPLFKHSVSNDNTCNFSPLAHCTVSSVFLITIFNFLFFSHLNQKQAFFLIIFVYFDTVFCVLCDKNSFFISVIMFSDFIRMHFTLWFQLVRKDYFVQKSDAMWSVPLKSSQFPSRWKWRTSIFLYLSSREEIKVNNSENKCGPQQNYYFNFICMHLKCD